MPLELEQSPVSIIETKVKANGDPYLYWSYQYTTVICFVNLKKKGMGFEIFGGIKGLPRSSVHISDQPYSIIISKSARYIEVFWENEPPSTILYDTSFTAEELEQLEQFYPRDAVLDPYNSNIFYVKLPTRIARFAIMDNKKVKFVGIVRDYQTYVLDEEWSFAYTGSNILTIRDKQLKEEYYNPSENKFETLQTLSMEGTSFSNFKYDARSKFATVSLKADSNGKEQVKVLVPS